jgi:hypothetical protein
MVANTFTPVTDCWLNSNSVHQVLVAYSRRFYQAAGQWFESTPRGKPKVAQMAEQRPPKNVQPVKQECGVKVDDYIEQYSKMYGDDFTIYQHFHYTEITFRMNGKPVLIGKLFK